ncbi:histidine triad nucleotide-binding protein [Pseudonocardiaceae bacterium YIM PH 21723]|nr:histidine triad nucleotide-binding protein [Pseudonocardiaceae bacterium YIM PH 21723]
MSDAAANSSCLFCKIVNGQIPALVVGETERALAFRDINPQAPTHVLVVPRTHYPNAAALANADAELTADMIRLAGKIAESEGIADSGYRLMFNTGEDGGQTVFHVHLHVLGGKNLGPMVAI